MNDSGAKTEGSQPLTGRRAALTDIAERRRKNPNWNSKTDPTYVGPYPTFVELMSNAEFDRHLAGVVERPHLANRAFCGLIAVPPVLAQHLSRRMHVEHIGWAPTTSLACSEAQGNELWATGRPSVRSYPGQFIARTRRR